MAPKNTTLEVGPLSVPIAMEKISVRSDVKIDRASMNGNKIKRVEIDAVTGEEIVSDSDIQRGVFENAKDGTGFRAISKEALEAIEAETKIDSFVVDQFVPLSEVPFERTQAAYFIAPQKNTGSAKPLKLLYESLRKTKKAGVLKITLTSRQYAAVIYAKDGGIVLNTLAFASDFTKVARAAEALDGATADKRLVALMSEFIEASVVDAAAVDALEDDLVPLKQSLVDDALSGKAFKPRAKRKARTPISGDDALMDALRESALEVKRNKASSGKGRQAAAVG